MNVSELFTLTEWVTEKIEKAHISQKYKTLHSVLTANAQPNQQKQAFEAQKTDLFISLEAITYDHLTKEQMEYLKMFSIAPYIGSEGKSLVEDILYKNLLDISTAIIKIQEIMIKLDQGLNKIKQIKTGLSGILVVEEFEASQDVLLRISFKGDASINNIKDLKTWGNTWFEIGYGVALAHDLPAEEIKIIGASKGSIVLELVVACAIAKTVSTVILSALKVVERILEIRKKIEEIRELKLKNDLAASELEKAAKEEKENGTENIVKSIVSLLKLSIKEKEGDKEAALSKAIANLVTFIENGGNVDFVLPNINKQSDKYEELPDFSELRNAFSEIRALEERLLLLEHKAEVQ